jgi:hypothetical protein
MSAGGIRPQRRICSRRPPSHAVRLQSMPSVCESSLRIVVFPGPKLLDVRPILRSIGFLEARAPYAGQQIVSGYQSNDSSRDEHFRARFQPFHSANARRAASGSSPAYNHLANARRRSRRVRVRGRQRRRHLRIGRQRDSMETCPNDAAAWRASPPAGFGSTGFDTRGPDS